MHPPLELKMDCCIWAAIATSAFPSQWASMQFVRTIHALQPSSCAREAVDKNKSKQRKDRNIVDPFEGDSRRVKREVSLLRRAWERAWEKQRRKGPIEGVLGVVCHEHHGNSKNWCLKSTAWMSLMVRVNKISRTCFLLRSAQPKISFFRSPLGHAAKATCSPNFKVHQTHLGMSWT
jgi:hypothetical protein